MKNKFILMLVGLLTSLILGNQTVLTDAAGCTPQSDKAKRAVESFLTESHIEEFRVESGTVGVPTSEIKHVGSSLICQRLRNLITSNPNLQNNDPDKTLYFYQTNNFYYVFYQYDSPWKLGSHVDFNVISKQFTVLGMYYL